MNKITVGMVSLGCPKNQVDAEMLLYRLRSEGFAITNDPTQADAVIINTCGFIDDAKQESIDNILEFGALRQAGKLRCLVVTGCLAERYQEEVAAELPEADVVAGIGAHADIGRLIREALGGAHLTLFPDKLALPLEGGRLQSTPAYTAYLKIAEGCSNGCTYCAIPMIRGPYRSREREHILAEARDLAAHGVRELIVIAQDTTRYGEDLYPDYRLADLLDDLAAIDGLHWIRTLYSYPERIDDRLIETVASHENLLPYFDIPIQHMDDIVLRRMNRRTTGAEIRAVIEKIRARIPEAILRTTLIAGFPGESEAAYAKLMDFVVETRFDRLGCFAYSAEEGTPAARLPHQLEEPLKRHRAEMIMERQMVVAAELGQRRIGETLEVLIEGETSEGGYHGRSWMDAPEIDGQVYVRTEHRHRPGEFIPVVITGATDYDLIGEEIL